MSVEKASRLKTILVFSIFTGFTICIFAPFEVYLSGKEGFFFSGRDIIAFSGLLFVSLTVILYLVLLLISKLNNIVGDYSLALCFGLVIAFYLQGNFDFTDYGVWNGSDIDWNCFVISKYIWIVIFVICILASVLAVKKLGIVSFNKTISIISILIILLQTLTIITLLFAKNGLNKEPEYVAVEIGECEFSSEENLIILVLDSYDSMMLTEILNKDEDGYYAGILSDFVFYPDTVGTYSFTNLAVPHMITGNKYYNDMTYGEYLNEAYDSAKILNSLFEKGWDIGLYTDSTFPNNSKMNNRIENCKLIKRTVTSHRRLAGYMYRIIGFRYVPQPFKRYFVYTEDIESEIGGNDQDFILFGTMNNTFKRALKKAEADRSNRVFKLIHIYGAHPPYYANADESETKEATTELEVCKDNLELVDEFLDKLREIGAYDNSTIIICADHGVMQHRQAPLFMIKGRNAKHELSVDDTPFSYDSLEGLFEVIISGADSKEISKYIDERSSDDRVYLQYSHDTLHYDSYCEDIVEYSVCGPAYEEQSLTQTGKVYTKPR